MVSELEWGNKCICHECGVCFTSRRSNSMFCSNKCRHRHRRANPEQPARYPSAKRYEKTCVECGAVFVAKRSNAKICGMRCHQIKWYRENPESIKERLVKYRESRNAISRAWGRANRERVAQRKQARYRTDAQFRLSHTLSTRVRKVLKGKAPKAFGTMTLLGCDWEVARKYLESMFRPGMSWHNYGKEWQIDHIKPTRSFDLTNPEEQKRCFHISNLQPLFCDENACKHDRLLHPEQYLRPGQKIPAPIFLDSILSPC